MLKSWALVRDKEGQEEGQKTERDSDSQPHCEFQNVLQKSGYYRIQSSLSICITCMRRTYNHLHHTEEGVLTNGFCCSASGGASLSRCLAFWQCVLLAGCHQLDCPPTSPITPSQLTAFNSFNSAAELQLQPMYKLWWFENCRSPYEIRSPPVSQSVSYITCYSATLLAFILDPGNQKKPGFKVDEDY